MKVLTETRRRQFLNIAKGRPMNAIMTHKVPTSRIQIKGSFKHKKFNFGCFNTRTQRREDE